MKNRNEEERRKELTDKFTKWEKFRCKRKFHIDRYVEAKKLKKFVEEFIKNIKLRWILVKYLTPIYKENIMTHIIKYRSLWFYIKYRRAYAKSISRKGGKDLKRRKWIRGFFTLISNTMESNIEIRAK